MKRTGFAPKWPRRPARQWTGALPTARKTVARIVDACRAIVSVPKENARRSEPYRRWVASRPCIHCRRAGPSQCAHSDSGGKGMALKTSDETCFPLCADAPGYRGCHSRIGASGALSQAGRRELETFYSAVTQRLARHTGNWPKEWA